jgi:3-oxoadipate enol-lactonase/4-carboxymuconolactone decarboxylase
MPFAENHGVRLYWRSDGDPAAPPILLLGAIGTDLSLWDAVTPHLAERFHVLRMDTRGHGASDAPPGDYDLPTLAADAAVVLDAAGAPRATVAGLSLGGMIAMTLALEAPERVERLALICTSPAMDRATWQARIDTVRAEGTAAIAEAAMQRYFSKAFRTRQPAVVNTVRAGLLGMSAQGYAGCGAAIRDMALTSRLKAITAPTLVITGSRDVSTPFESHGAAILAAIPGATHRQLATAHLPCLEAPVDLAGALIAFAAPAEPSVRAATQTLYDAGLAQRRRVLGDAWVDRALGGATEFNADFQAMITRTAWQEVWSRPGLDERTRRLLTIAMTGALGRWEEFRLHARAALESGAISRGELKETLMQMAVYAGVPAANTAFKEAAEVLDALPD